MGFSRCVCCMHRMLYFVLCKVQRESKENKLRKWPDRAPRSMHSFFAWEINSGDSRFPVNQRHVKVRPKTRDAWPFLAVA